MRHPDDQPTGDARSFRSDGAVTSHDVARMSDAELLSLYQGLFAQSDAGTHPGQVDAHGPSLQELAEGNDELSRAGNELARRYEERGGAVRDFLQSHLSVAETPGVTIRLFSNHDVEYRSGHYRDSVAHAALTMFVAAVTVNNYEFASHHDGAWTPSAGSGTNLIFLGGLDMRTGQVLTMHEFAAIHFRDVFVQNDDQGLIQVDLPVPEVKAFGVALLRGIEHAVIDYLGEKVADHLKEWAVDTISGHEHEHGAGPDSMESNYSLLDLAIDSGIADGDGTAWDMQHARDSELRESSAPTTDDLARETAVQMVQGLMDAAPLFEGVTNDHPAHGDQPVDIQSASQDEGSAAPGSATGFNMEADAAAAGFNMETAGFDPSQDYSPATTQGFDPSVAGHDTRDRKSVV